MDPSHTDGIFRRRPTGDSAGFSKAAAGGGGGDGIFRRRTMEDSAVPPGAGFESDRAGVRSQRSSSGRSTDNLSLFSSLESEEPLRGDNPLIDSGPVLVIRSQKSNLNIDWFRARIATSNDGTVPDPAPNSAPTFLLSIANDCIGNYLAALIPILRTLGGTSRINTVLRPMIFLCLSIGISLFCYLWGRLDNNGGGGITLQAGVPSTAIKPSDFLIYRLLPY